MSKYLPKSAAKRLPLTTKRAGKGYYKGKGGTKQGTHTGRAGAYVLDKNLMVELVVPDLEGFKVRACVRFVRGVCLDGFFVPVSRWGRPSHLSRSSLLFL